MKLPFSKFLSAAITVAGMVAPAPAQPISQNMELMGAIAREIVNSGEPQGVDWVEVCAIFSLDADGDVNGSYGYVYDAQGQAHAAAFLEDPIEREVKAYRDWLLHKGRKGDRASSRCSFNSTGRRGGSARISSTRIPGAGRSRRPTSMPGSRSFGPVSVLRTASSAPAPKAPRDGSRGAARIKAADRCGSRPALPTARCSPRAPGR